MPAAAARSNPRRLSTRPMYVTSSRAGSAASTASASAICGTRFGFTKLQTSMRRTPASTAREISSTFVSVSTTASSDCSPSRGATSTTSTCTVAVSHPVPDLPLADVRVIEMGTLLAGPFCAQLLGDFGAEVIKLEPPGDGDPMREWGREKPHGLSLWWPVVALNKKSVTCNLRVAAGQELAKRLIAKA